MKKINRFEPWKHQTIITNACVYSIQNRTNNKRNGFFFSSLNQSQLHAQILNNNILLTRKPIVACVFPSSNHFKCLLIIFFFLFTRSIYFVSSVHLGLGSRYSIFSYPRRKHTPSAYIKYQLNLNAALYLFRFGCFDLAFVLKISS